MRLRILSLLIIELACAGLPSTYADGLVTKLPAEGEWATFELKAEVTQPNGKYTESPGTVTLKSLGSEVVDNQKCRWIEIQMDFDWPGDGKEVPDRKFTSIWKLLVKESSFVDDSNPVDGIVRGYFAHASHPRDLVANERDIKKDKLVTDYLHDPFVMPQSIGNKNITTDQGELECLGVEDKVVERDQTQPDKELSTTQYQRWTNDKSPFGVAEFQFDRQSAAGGRMKHVLVLKRWGTNSESLFPDKK